MPYDTLLRQQEHKSNKGDEATVCIHYSPGENFSRRLDILIENFIGFPSHSNNATVSSKLGAWGSVVVKALRYKLDGPGIDSRWCHWGYFPWLPQQNYVP